MRDGQWRIAILAIGWLALTAAEKVTEPPANETQTAAGGQQQHAANPIVLSAPPVPKSTYRPYPNRYDEACYTAKDHDSADLCAQWRAALSGEKAAEEAHRATFWSIFASWINLLAVAGLLGTIWQTQRALTEARLTNKHTSEGQRAWVSSTVSIDRFTFDGDKVAIEYTCIFTNSGDTVAREVYVETRCFTAQTRAEASEIARIHRHIRDRRKPGRDALIPKESLTYLLAENVTVHSHHWDERGNIVLLIVTSVFYKTNLGEDAATEQSYTIGRTISGAGNIRFLRQDMEGCEVDDLAVMSHRSGEVT
ncbi:hypothetical protein [Sphingomonas sp. VDB2]|uniref:hypothetical protein n=1 Tax=Sphingomonas sp. VDB2 TaxID=3228751 RepID=UPI003A802631